jgi:hypothetical protein
MQRVLWECAGGAESFVRGFRVDPSYLSDSDGEPGKSTVTMQIHSLPLSELPTIADLLDYSPDVAVGVEQHFTLDPDGARKLGELLIRSADALEAKAEPSAQTDPVGTREAHAGPLVISGFTAHGATADAEEDDLPVSMVAIEIASLPFEDLHLPDPPPAVHHFYLIQSEHAEVFAAKIAEEANSAS